MSTVARTKIVCLLPLLLSALACGGSGGGGGSGSASIGDRSLQGGDTSSSDRTALAFENPASNLDAEGDQRHREGDKNFGSIFVTPPATFNAGLGPLFNNNSCDSCHTKNGRGQPVFGTGFQGSQAILRVSIAGGVQEVPGSPGDVPGIGTQLKDHATFGTSANCVVNLQWEAVPGEFDDGQAFELRKPNISVTLANGSQLAADVMTSVRTAPPVFGVGLLEAIPDADIIALADPDDADGDGISGRPNYIWDFLKQSVGLGRFGRKANRVSLLEQSAAAYANDIGVSNPVFPDANGSSDIDNTILKSVEFYVQSIAVPVAGDITDSSVKSGERLFIESSCGSCHTPKLQTGSHPLAALTNQTIFPYTDLLLHDMGEGLADNRPDFQASGSEWRTTPLWGIGVTATILSSTENFMHDGRARTLEEAILWHGGEAEGAKEKFRTMSASDRKHLIDFLKSL